ncbi:3-dehydroquinate synthase [Flavobacteriaceae bacterium D16]|nr:3-dehydroquinate synthase [Flavobacteriaceae bacterium D16]
MDAITTNNGTIYFDDEAYYKLRLHLKDRKYSKVFILVDENTAQHCLPEFRANMGGKFDFKAIQIKSGEIHKNIETCMEVWKQLSDMNADRRSLLINLGGGVITDLGGFVASTFKRGIDFVNVPTTLLSMVDASIGGKTGVDLGVLKNQIGVFNNPEMVLVVPDYLSTLDKRQLNSGFAEMMKHGLIASGSYWMTLKKVDSFENLDKHIYESLKIKNDIVSQDPKEKNLRKILNFGHTFGHAIESYSLEDNNLPPLLHGEAIAIGMILEGYLSNRIIGLGMHQLEDIKAEFTKRFDKVDFTDEDVEEIVGLLKFDKKNTRGSINFVVLKRIGDTIIDNKIPKELFQEAFSYYKD